MREVSSLKRTLRELEWENAVVQPSRTEGKVSELVTNLDFDSFLLAFTRFTDLRGPVDTMFSDNASTFKAAANLLPQLLNSSEFVNSLRKKNRN